MFPAHTQNLPSVLKPTYSGWPVLSATFEQFVAAVSACKKGEVVVGRFSPPLHTAYLVDLEQERLVRCVRSEPMRVQLRRQLAPGGQVVLRAAEASV